MYVGCVNGNPRRFTDAIQAHLDYMSDVSECFADINALFAEARMDLINPDNIGLEIFEEKTDKPKTSFVNKTSKSETGSPSFAARLGKKIKELIEKIKNIIVSFTDAIRGKDREYEKVQAEIEKRMRKDPSLKSMVIDAAEKGLIDYRDIRYITEFDEAVEKITAEKNPKTFKQKFAAFKKKWEDPSKTKTASRIAFVASVISLSVALYKFMPGLKEATNKLRDGRKRDAEELKKFAEYLNSEEAKEKGLRSIEEMDAVQLRMAFHSFVNSKRMEMERQVSRDYDQMNSILKKVVTGVNNSKSGQKTKDKFLHADYDVKISKSKSTVDKLKSDYDKVQKTNGDEIRHIRENILKTDNNISEYRRKIQKLTDEYRKTGDAAIKNEIHDLKQRVTSLIKSNASYKARIRNLLQGITKASVDFTDATRNMESIIEKQKKLLNKKK